MAGGVGGIASALSSTLASAQAAALAAQAANAATGGTGSATSGGDTQLMTSAPAGTGRMSFVPQPGGMSMNLPPGQQFSRAPAAQLAQLQQQQNIAGISGLAVTSPGQPQAAANQSAGLYTPAPGSRAALMSVARGAPEAPAYPGYTPAGPSGGTWANMPPPAYGSPQAEYLRQTSEQRSSAFRIIEGAVGAIPAPFLNPSQKAGITKGLAPSFTYRVSNVEGQTEQSLREQRDTAISQSYGASPSGSGELEKGINYLQKAPQGVMNWAGAYGETYRQFGLKTVEAQSLKTVLVREAVFNPGSSNPYTELQAKRMSIEAQASAWAAFTPPATMVALGTGPAALAKFATPALGAANTALATKGAGALMIGYTAWTEGQEPAAGGGSTFSIGKGAAATVAMLAGFGMAERVGRGAGIGVGLRSVELNKAASVSYLSIMDRPVAGVVAESSGAKSFFFGARPVYKGVPTSTLKDVNLGGPDYRIVRAVNRQFFVNSGIQPHYAENIALGEAAVKLTSGRAAKSSASYGGVEQFLSNEPRFKGMAPEVASTARKYDMMVFGGSRDAFTKTLPGGPEHPVKDIDLQAVYAPGEQTIMKLLGRQPKELAAADALTVAAERDIKARGGMVRRVKESPGLVEARYPGEKEVSHIYDIHGPGIKEAAGSAGADYVLSRVKRPTAQLSSDKVMFSTAGTEAENAIQSVFKQNIDAYPTSSWRIKDLAKLTPKLRAAAAEPRDFLGNVADRLTGSTSAGRVAKAQDIAGRLFANQPLRAQQEALAEAGERGIKLPNQAANRPARPELRVSFRAPAVMKGITGLTPSRPASSFMSSQSLMFGSSYGEGRPSKAPRSPSGAQSAASMMFGGSGGSRPSRVAYSYGGSPSGSSSPGSPSPSPYSPGYSPGSPSPSPPDKPPSPPPSGSKSRASPDSYPPYGPSYGYYSPPGPSPSGNVPWNAIMPFGKMFPETGGRASRVSPGGSLNSLIGSLGAGFGRPAKAGKRRK